MTYDIIRTPGTLYDLRNLVEAAMRVNGCRPLGAPFRDENERQWCQAITGPQASDDVRLREPKKK